MGDTGECTGLRWEMAEGGVASDGAGCGKEGADFVGEAVGVQEDGLAEDNIGDLGGDDVGDIYKYGNAVPNSFVTLQASVVGYLHASGYWMVTLVGNPACDLLT